MPGANVLPQSPPPSSISIFLSQFRNPLVYVLLVAGAVTLLTRHVADAIIILIVVLLNTVLGFVQERKTNQAFSALKQFLIKKCVVVRNGKHQEIDTSQVVVGDEVILAAGSKVPADGRITFANRLYIDEAIITGESIPVNKNQKDEVFMGSVVVSGQATIQVTSIGANTRIGHVAKEVQTIDRDTPLRKQLANFSQKLTIGVVGLTLFVFLIGLIRGQDLITIFTTSVSLAVSSIPEGLTISLTVVLAVGMQKILQKRGLVRKLASAETLGGVTTICMDKTGTLTEGKMQVVEYIGNKTDLAQQILLANDLDDPIVIAAFEWGRSIIKDFVSKHPRLDSIPFSPQERVFSSLHRWTGQHNIVFVNGAPDILLNYTTLDELQKNQIRAQIDELASQGKRLMGLARKEVTNTKNKLIESDSKTGLDWVGLLAFYDPVRPSVKQALTLTQQAGIKIIVITGDYPKTAQYVLSELNLEDKVTLYARTTPEQKLKIVEDLQSKGEVVAMMGDGVNDAAAIHRADIGIVVSSASDVARESADLVLLDSNFSTVVAAIEEGRAIFDNIRKIILYLLSDAFGEILVVIGSIIFNLPLPITAVQIIWINLVSDGFPGLALTIDPSRPGIMREKPREIGEKLVNNWMKILIGSVSIFAGGMAFIVFVITYKMTNNLPLAQSLTFVTLGLNSLTYVFSVRSLLVPFWQNRFWENKWLMAAVAAGLGLQMLPFANTTTRAFFGVVHLEIWHWVLAIGLSILVFLMIETFKLLYKLLQ